MNVRVIGSVALAAVMLAAFQNCGKLGFSLDHNAKSLGLSLAHDADVTRPQMNISADLPVARGTDAGITVLTKNVETLNYVCQTRVGGVEVSRATLTLTDGVATAAIRADEDLACTFTAATGVRTSESLFEITTE